MIKSISIILPFYNEEKRLSKSLNHISLFLSQNKKLKKEIIFVDDGSVDNSNLIIKRYLKKKFSNSQLKLFHSKENLGKESALKIGVKKARHEWILTADIDMSVPLNKFLKWDKKNLLKNNLIFFGSRDHPNSKVDSKLLRKILGNILKLINKYLFSISIQDTQCGYKIYKKKMAKKIFSKLKTKGFSHDIELILLSKIEGSNPVELPVEWKHKTNSKLNVLTEPFKMFLSLIKIKILYIFL